MGVSAETSGVYPFVEVAVVEGGELVRNGLLIKVVVTTPCLGLEQGLNPR